MLQKMLGKTFLLPVLSLSCEKNKKFTSFDDGADTVINSSLILQMPDEGSAILIFYNHSSLALYFCARDYTSAHLRCETD